MLDLVAVGEYLIDFTPAGQGLMGNPTYEMNPGGAPTNCAAAVAALGGSSAIISAVGDDLFGRFLLEALKEFNIDNCGVQLISDIHTTLAFVSLKSHGEREFAFLRDPGADTQLNKKHLDYSLIDSCKNLHFGSLSLKQDPGREATYHAVQYAKARGIQISYDPNYRAPLWESKEQAVCELKNGLKYADIVKMSEDEMELLLEVPASKPREGAKKLFKMGISTCYITYGAKGAFYATETEQGFVNGFCVKAVDTTGCGDAFMGAAIYMQLYKPELPLCERVRFANAVGALCATKMGGMMAMPKLEQVKEFLKNN